MLRPIRSPLTAFGDRKRLLVTKPARCQSISPQSSRTTLVTCGRSVAVGRTSTNVPYIGLQVVPGYRLRMSVVSKTQSVPPSTVSTTPQ
jgi:hypothetical protein